MRYKTVLILAAFVTVYAFGGFLVYSDEEEMREKHKDYKRAEPAAPKEQSRIKERFEFKIFAGAKEGYDNNVYLDSSRKADTFDEARADILLRYKLSENLRFKTVYDFTSITYHEFTDLTMFDNDIAAALEYHPCKKTKIEAGYDVDFINYLRNEDGNFYTNGPFAKFRYYFTPRSYLGAGYQYRFYDYDKRQIRDGTNKRLEITREDHRHSIIGELAFPLSRFYVSIRNTYYFNDSNDGYIDYYDYQSEKVTASITYPLSEKIYLLLNGGYQHKDFKSRTITTSSSKERDNLMILGAGGYYKILPSLYMNLDYTYRQNYSNDPIQEYSGAIGTVGLHYFF